MSTTLGPRTVLRVSRTDDGNVEIALVVESTPDGTQTLRLRPGDVPTLIEMLQRQIATGDPEDLTTLRNLRRVT